MNPRVIETFANPRAVIDGRPIQQTKLTGTSNNVYYMKLEIYEPHKVGYVSLNPYEWEYDGRYQSVVELLESQPDFQKGISVPSEEDEIADGVKDATGEDYLQMIARELYKRKVWNCLIVDE